LYYTKQFEDIYNSTLQLLGDKKVIVLTHTPVDNWTKSEYNPKWIYVNGHTHRNRYVEDEKCTIYSDNQIGYNKNKLALKYFKLDTSVDIFAEYEDGIYEISIEEYTDFYFYKKYRIRFNQNEGKVIMVKRDGLYCFLYKDRLLNGGRITKKLTSKDAFDLMAEYSNIIKSVFEKYTKALITVSNEVKRIGGSGIIHGAIVDIDYFNHLYINPSDGKITPYYALSIQTKYVYDNIQSLLKTHNKQLYSNYCKLLSGKTSEITVLPTIATQCERTGTYDPDTTIYRNSRKLKTIQYLMEDNIIREFDQEIIDLYYASKNNASNIGFLKS
jgi:hypothetical protein